jgi:glycerol-3-phosphate acyltransferase PlsY
VWAAVLVFAYLVGSFPSAPVLARLVGKDPPRRTTGPDPSSMSGLLIAAILVADAVTGMVPVMAAWWLVRDAAVQAAAAVLAVAGHVFPVTRGFAGGRGVATAFGALVALCPLGALWALAVFCFAFALDQRLSFASLLGLLSAPAAIAIFPYPLEDVAAALLIAALVIFRHGDNLRRLRAGTEPRFELPKKQSPPAN